MARAVIKARRNGNPQAMAIPRVRPWLARAGILRQRRRESVHQPLAANSGLAPPGCAPATSKIGCTSVLGSPHPCTIDPP